jgi:8-amino-7-oxononanoate synthase
MTFYRNARWNRWNQDMTVLRDFSAHMHLPHSEGTYFLTRTRNSGASIDVAGRELLNFSSYDYLGLSQHPEVLAAAHAALDRYGASASASRIASGQTQAHVQLDARLAEFLGTPAAMTFNSGYGTNATTIGHLFDVRDLILHDAYMHQSALEGIALSGAHRMSFPHNDVAALAQLLRSEGGNYRRVVVLVEGAYSMDGDVCSLRAVAELKREHRFVLMVDEAHSLGTVGRTGRGIAEHAGVARSEVDIWMGTLSKTLASCGGYIAGDADLINYLRYTCPGFIFSAGLAPVSAAAADAALAVLMREPERARQLQAQVQTAQGIARGLGLHIGTADVAPILPVILGDRDATLYTAFALYQRGICVHPMVYPTVAKGQGRLRFFLTLQHTEVQLRSCLQMVGDVMLEASHEALRRAVAEAQQPSVSAPTSPSSRAASPVEIVSGGEGHAARSSSKVVG